MISSLQVAATALALTPADSARVVENVYAVSLLAIVPLLVVAVAAILMRRAPAGTRSLIWRSAIVTLLVAYVVRQFPLQWLAWTLPDVLSAPFIMLGRVQVAGGGGPAMVGEQLTSTIAGGAAASLVQILYLIYALGVFVVLAPTVVALVGASVSVSRARPLHDNSWLTQLDEVRRLLGVRRHVSLGMSDAAIVPRTWGFFRPVILLPASALNWTETQRRAVLLHELSHIRAGDWPMALTARVVCALYWFHPGAWWISRSLRRECEYACDNTVLAAGVRPSDYAELLALAADSLPGRAPEFTTVLALSRGIGLRERLRAILDTSRDVRAPGAARQITAAAMVVVMSLSLGTVRLTPTKEILARLMLDARWESRAYAVIGLAQRADSVATAREAASSDPSPQVRAWAQYALARLNNSNGQ